MLPAGLAGHRTGRLDEPDRATRSVRDIAVDLLCVLVSLVIGALSLLISSPDDPLTPSWEVSIALGVAASVALWWRRRFAVSQALILIGLSAWFLTVGGASVIALFTVAVHRKTKPVVWLTGLSLVASLVQYRVQPLDPDTPLAYWLAVLINSLLLVLAVGWGMAVRARRQLVVSLAERAYRAETEQELRIGQARMRERERIAREMHDMLAHRLSLLSMHAGALEFRPDMPDEELSRAAGVIRATAHQSLLDLREVIYVLREPGEGEEDLVLREHTLADLPELVEETRQTGTEVRYDERLADVGEAPAQLASTVYRILQEGLTNTRKHAPGSAVRIQVLGGPDDGVTLEMVNPVAGDRPRPDRLDPAGSVPGSGSGLHGLGERASLAGGRLEHGRTTGGEFRLWAWLPWPS
ncbi:sensor histidine kinase [Kutzneria sp. CA-103260]|nr:sensor histidine kinase [Kutzneria sp. CA-103260]